MSQTKERPILFSGPMVRAILEGRKTVTRRLVKGGQYPVFNGDEPEHGLAWTAVAQRHPRYGFCVSGATEEQCAAELSVHGLCPYGKAGDRLWVRETCLINDYRDNDVPEAERTETQVIYKADGLPDWEGEEAEIRWRPSIHMPRWCSRILLEITAARVERLQDITEDQSRAEGAAPAWLDADDNETVYAASAPTYRQGFAKLWRDINGDEAWGTNPWVWVVEFKRVMP